MAPIANTELWLIRHGESEFNRDGRIQGQLDPPLSPLGRQQARLLAEARSGAGLQAIYSSHLSRATATAEALAEAAGLTVIPEPRLVEAGFGEWEGLTRGDIQARFPGQMERWQADPIANRPPGGETIEALQNRAMAAVNELTRRHAGERVAIVCHGGTIRSILCGALEMPLTVYPRLRVENTSVTCLLMTPRRTILASFNDTSHLAELTVGAGSR